MADRVTDRPDPEPLDVAGALDPVDRPVGELWRSPDLQADGLVDVDGLLVGTADRADRSVDLVAVDSASGATVWSTRLLDGGPRHGGARCVTPDPDAGGAGRTVCVTADAVGPVDDFSPSSVVESTRARRLVVDVATGAVRQERPVDPSTSLAALGRDLVTSTVGADGVLRVARTDVLGTTERWAFTGGEPLRSTRFGRSARVAVLDDLVVAGGAAGWSLTVDGAPLQRWTAGPSSSRAGRSGPRWTTARPPTSCWSRRAATRSRRTRRPRAAACGRCPTAAPARPVSSCCVGAWCGSRSTP